MLNNTTTFGNGNQNLILETAGRVYIKVSDKFYELNFRDQTSNKEPAVINNNIAQKEEADLSNYITKRDLKSSLAQYITKRDWQDVKETQRKLEEALLDGFSESINPITVQTMQVIVGSEQLQFEFIENDSLHPNGTSPYITTPHSFGIQDGRLFCNPGLILHHTIDCPDAVRPGSVSGYEGQQDTKYYCRWHVGNSEVTWFDFDSDEQSYYLYIRAEKLNLTNAQRNDPTNDSIKVGNASFFLSAEPYSLDPDDGYYYFLYAIINSDNGDGRSIGTMNGFTEILPGQITAYIFKSADGIQFVDFLNKQFHIGYAPGPGEIATTGTVDNGSYMHWDSHNGLVIKGNITVTGGELQDTLNDLQRQIDDEVQAWFSSDSNNTNPAGHKHDRPTNNNWPANEWTIDSLKKEHSGDLYYIVDGTYEGETYRYAKVDSSYAWVVVSDSSVAEALRVAYEAMGLAEENEAKLNSWIDDGVISPTEMSGIREEYEFIQSDYDNLSKEKDLYGLGSSTEWTNYQSAYTLYYNWLNKIIYSYDNADPDVLDEYGNVDLSEVASKYSSVLTDTFANAMSNYYDKRTIFYKHAATTISSGISTAISAAANAQTTANNVTTYVGKSLADDVLSKDEIEVLQTYKKSLADQYTAISSSYTDLIAQASAILQDPDFDHSSSAYINLNATYLALTTTNTGSYAVLSSTYTNLVNSVNAILNCGMTAVGTTDSRLHSLKTAFDAAANAFSTAIAAYIDDVQELNVYIADANKYITIEGYRYLTEAIVNGTTTIAGGLVATNTIVLGNTPQSGGYKITAGINGITTINSVEDTTAIAAWYGGPFRDKSYYYTWDFDDGWVLKPAYISNPPSASDYAQTVFRHNGTGYVAGGAITWNADGSGSVANGALYWNALGVPTLGGGIEVDLSDGAQTLNQIAAKLSLVLSWFEEDANHNIRVKNYGESGGETGTARGLYNEGFMSAGGLSSSGGASGIDPEEMWRYLKNTSSDHTYDRELIATAHIPDMASVYGYVKNVDMAAITALIPEQATPGNQLADKAFVNSSIATATSTFRGTNTTATTESAFLAWANALTHDLNDYVFWKTEDAVGNTVYKRYKFTGAAWEFEYDLNNSSFTAVQWAAINSGVTASRVSEYDAGLTTLATLAGYFSNGVLGTSHLPALYLGTTPIQTASAEQNVTGIGNLTMGFTKTLNMQDDAASPNSINALQFYKSTVSSPTYILRLGGGMTAADRRTLINGGAEVRIQTGRSTSTTHIAFHENGDGVKSTRLYSYLSLPNAAPLYMYDNPTDGTQSSAREVLYLSNTNYLRLGYATATKGYATRIHGSLINFYTAAAGGSQTVRLQITADGIISPYVDIVPNTNNAIDLGSSTRFFAEAYAKKVYLAANTYLEVDSNGYVHLVTPSGKGFYCDGFVSAGGLSTGGGSTGIDALAMWKLLTNNQSLTSYDNNTKIATAHIPDMASTYGYLKSEDISDMATKTWVATQNFSTVANTVSNVAVGGSGHTEELAITKGGTTSYLTVPYANTVKRFKRYDGTLDVQGGYDLNTLLAGGGITSQYNSMYTWGNGPDGMSFGGAVQLNPFVGQTLAMQLAWDIDHTNVKTGHLWWRDSIYKNSTHTWGEWRLIYDDTTLTKSVITGLLDDGNGTYVKLNPGRAEQTISSNISSLDKGVVNLWRKSGDHFTFLGFSNGTTETYLGGIGFKSQSDHNLYRKYGSNYYKIWDEANSNLASVNWACKDLSAAGHVTLANNKHIRWMSNPAQGETAQAIIALEFTTSNNLYIGYGVANSGHFTRLYGNTIEFITGSTTRTNAFVLSDSNATMYRTFVPSINNRYDLGSSELKWRTIWASTGICSDGYVSAGGVSSSSDARLKDNIKDFNYSAELLMSLKPREWDWNGKTTMVGHSAGFVAQEVEPYLSYAVTERTYKQLTYDIFHALEVSALQDHETRIKALELENRELKDEIKRLKTI